MIPLKSNYKPGVTVSSPPVVVFPVVLSGPSIQRQGLLPSSTQQHGSIPAQRRHPPGAVARPGEPGSACTEPEGLLCPAGRCEGAGPLHSLPLAQDISPALLHGPGWAAGIHLRPDDQPRLQSSSLLSCRGCSVPPDWQWGQQTGSTDESELSQVSNRVKDSTQPAKQPKKKRDEGQRRA